MDLFTRDDLEALLPQGQGACVSLYLPTHRGGAEEDPIRWRGHVREAERQLLAAGLRTPAGRDLLAPARRLGEDGLFWKNQCDGLAAFLAPDFLRLYRLPVRFADLVVVGTRFHVKPLLPLVGGNDRFYVLALSQHAVRLLQGTRHGTSAVDLRGAPHSLAEALLAHEAREPFTFHGRRAGEGAGSWAGIFHGHGVGIDEAKGELLHYFQKIDRALHPLLCGERAPLVLAAVDYLMPIYRLANTYPHLLDRGIEGNPDRLTSRELHDRAWAVVAPHLHEASKKAAARYDYLAGTGRTAGGLEEVVRAACGGGVEVLFVALDRECWGLVDLTTDQVEVHGRAEPGDEDLLNLAALHTLSSGGTVYALPREDVPGGDAAAAIVRLSLARPAQ
jgi:hypothetical protein